VDEIRILAEELGQSPLVALHDRVDAALESVLGLLRVRGHVASRLTSVGSEQQPRTEPRRDSGGQGQVLVAARNEVFRGGSDREITASRRPPTF
jgi:hypothetical protein